MSLFPIDHFIWSSQGPRIWYSMNVLMFGRLIKPGRILLWATPDCWWSSLVQLSLPSGPVLPTNVNGKHFCHSQTTCAKSCCFSFNTQNIWGITSSFGIVRFRPVLPTFGVDMNRRGFCETCNLSYISVSSLRPILENMWNISTRPAKYSLCDNFKWSNWPGREQNTTTISGDGAVGITCLWV